MKNQSYFPLKSILVALLLFSPLLGFSQEDIEKKIVKFESGKSTTTITDTIKGYKIIDYVLGANEGQTLEVQFTTSNASSYFNLMSPGEHEVAFFNSSMAENSFTGALEKTGDQTIRVYLMRNAARRNESAKFTLVVGIK